MNVILDAGHGGRDSGAVAGSLREKDITLGIILKLRARIEKERKFGVACTRMSDQYVGLARRVDFAHREHGEIFLSVHCNADAHADVGTASGFEVLVFEASYASGRLAKSIQKGLRNVLPIPDRGIKERKNLYVLKHTRMPAVLVEVGFIDHHLDQVLLKERQAEIAAALHRALVSFHGDA